MEELELKRYKSPQNMLDCPVCHHIFEVEDYDSGDCPNCGKILYRLISRDGKLMR